MSDQENPEKNDNQTAPEDMVLIPLDKPEVRDEPRITQPSTPLNTYNPSDNRNGGSGCSVAIVAIFAMAFGVGILPMLVVTGVVDNVLGLLGRPAEANVITTRTIVTNIRPLGQIVSISAEVAKADIRVEVNMGGLNRCGHSAMHVAQGAVEAGVDLMSVDENSISYNALTDTYTLELPAPQITSCRIEYIRQYEQQVGAACSVDWDNARLLAQHVAMTEFAEDALAGGILERAARETDLLMSNFVKALTGGEAEVTFIEAESILPPSCVPDLPFGWMRDDETGAWVPTS